MPHDVTSCITVVVRACQPRAKVEAKTKHCGVCCVQCTLGLKPPRPALRDGRKIGHLRGLCWRESRNAGLLKLLKDAVVLFGLSEVSLSVIGVFEVFSTALNKWSVFNGFEQVSVDCCCPCSESGGSWCHHPLCHKLGWAFYFNSIPFNNLFNVLHI